MTMLAVVRAARAPATSPVAAALPTWKFLPEATTAAVVLSVGRVVNVAGAFADRAFARQLVEPDESAADHPMQRGRGEGAVPRHLVAEGEEGEVLGDEAKGHRLPDTRQRRGIRRHWYAPQ